MQYAHEEVFKHTIEEFKGLDDLIASLSKAGWEELVPRPRQRTPGRLRTM